MDLIDALRAALGPDRVEVPDAPWSDLCRFDVGQPRACVTPTSTEEVVEVVRLARAHRVPVVPVGERTAYWWPLDAHRAIALRVSGLRGITPGDGHVRVGAGEPVRPLDVDLRGRGLHLPLHPDAYGETPIGALVAMGCTSGIGMGHGSILRWLTGLTVVTGAGEVLRTGAASAFSDTPPFLRDGVPDATGLFVGSEGTLGVITEVCLREAPAPWRVHLSIDRLADPSAAARLGRDLGLRGLYDTYRLVREIDRHRGASLEQATWRLDAWVSSPLDLDDARHRARWTARRLQEVLGAAPIVVEESDDQRAGRAPAYDARWNGPMGAHADILGQVFFVGLDVNAPWGCLDELLALADRVAAAQVGRGAPMTRTALYLSGELINLGMHTTFPPDPETMAWARDHQQRELEALSALPVVPYRLGRVWPSAMRDRLTPGWRAWFDAARAHLDPDGVLAPGHPLVTR